jgi:hypothetical protein
MPLTLVNKEVDVIEEAKLRGLVQITRAGDMWDCRAVVFNSQVGATSVRLSEERVVELFKVIGCPLPTEQAESHVVEFFDGPDASVWASFGFDSTKFPAIVAEAV